MKTSAKDVEVGSTPRARPGSAALARPVWALLAVLTLTGCSTLPLFYERGATLVYWWLNSYLDLDKAQQTSTRAALRDWFRWHRDTQLGQYADALAALRRDASDPLSAARICTTYEALRQRLREDLDRALPALAGLAASLDAEQRRMLARRYAESNQEMREEALAGTPDEQRERRANAAIDVARDLYGRLSGEQKALITARMAASPYDPVRRLDERAARQQDTLAALERIAALPASVREQAAVAELAALGASFSASPRAAYREYLTALTAYNCALIAEVHNSTSARQRAKALRKLQGYEDDLRGLSGR